MTDANLRHRAVRFATGLLVLHAAAACCALADAKAVHKVEFAEVEGRACLQPVQISADATLDDFRAAERRWVSRNVLGPLAPHLEVAFWGTNSGYLAQVADIRTETLYAEAVDGSEIAICFAFQKQ
jgi:hypothetical protein